MAVRPPHRLIAPLALGLLLLLPLSATLSGCSRNKKRPSVETTQGPTDTNPGAPLEPPGIQLPAPDGPFLHLTGPQVLETIRRSKAKGTVVNAWASWCGPCREEFPMLVSLKERLKAKGIEILFVAVDEPETEAAALAFAQEHGLTGPIVVAVRPLGAFKMALHEGWPGMLPASFLFDGEARLRYFWGGPVYEKELMPILEGFLAGKVVDGEAEFGLIPGKDFR